MFVKIILETILGILLIAGVSCAILAILFKEQWRRLLKYFQAWQADDAKREALSNRLDAEARKRLANEELGETIAREKAEAELEKEL